MAAGASNLVDQVRLASAIDLIHDPYFSGKRLIVMRRAVGTPVRTGDMLPRTLKGTGRCARPLPIQVCELRPPGRMRRAIGLTGRPR